MKRIQNVISLLDTALEIFYGKYCLICIAIKKIKTFEQFIHYTLKYFTMFILDSVLLKLLLIHCSYMLFCLTRFMKGHKSNLKKLNVMYYVQVVLTI